MGKISNVDKLKKILILDFDGTIIDSNFSKEYAIQKYIKKKYNIEILKKIDNYQFRNSNRYELITIAKGKPILDSEKTEIDLEVNKSVIKSSIDPFLYELFKLCTKRKIKIILVSNTPEKSLKNIINKLNIFDYFYKVIGKKEGMNKIKTFSEIVQNEIVKPVEILSVGDNIEDYLASKINNIPFHGISNYTFMNLSNKIAISNTLRGVIKSLK